MSTKDEIANRFEQPYPGLRPFEAEEAALFHGRAQHVINLLSRLEKTPFLAVVGGSGSGKSSLVRAGLLPALSQGYLFSAGADWRFIIMKPGDDPFHNLAREIQDGDEDAEPSPRQVASTEALLRSSHLSFPEAIRDAEGHDSPDQRPILLLIDQFEELFRFRHRRRSETEVKDRSSSERRNDATGFVNLLLATAAQTDLPVYVLLTMRSDFIGDCDAFEGLPQAVSDNQFLVPRLTREQIRDAIEKPLLCGFEERAEPALVNRIVNEAGTDPDQLPLMQHALMRTWRRVHSAGRTVLTIEDYLAVGGLKGALELHANEALDAKNVDQNIARHLFLSLCHHENGSQIVRREATIKEVADVAGVDPGDIYPVVRAFQRDERHFIVSRPAGDLSPVTLLDLSHESLLRQWDALEKWIKEESKSVADYRWLVDGAKRKGTASANFDPLRELDLKRAEDWKARQEPNKAWAARHEDDSSFAVAMDYIDDSRAAADQEAEAAKNRRFWTRAIVVAALVLFSGLAAWALVQRGDAREQSTKADLRKREAQNAELRAEGERDKGRALLYETRSQSADQNEELVQAWMYALESLNLRADKDEAAPATRGRLASIGLERAIRSQKNIKATAVTIGRNGRYVAAGVGNDVAVWELETGTPLPLLTTGSEKPVRSLRFSPDENLLASGGENGKVWVWDLNGNALPRTEIAGGSRVDVLAVDVLDGGRVLAAGTTSEDAQIVVWIDDKRIEFGHGEGISATNVSLAPAGESLTATFSDGSVHRWDLPVEAGISAKLESTELNSPSGKGTLMAMSRDGTSWAYVPPGEEEGTAAGLVYNKDGEVLFDMEGPVSALGIGDNGNLIAATGEGENLSLWEHDGENHYRLQSIPIAGAEKQICVSENGLWSATVASDGEDYGSVALEIWRTDGRETKGAAWKQAWTLSRAKPDGALEHGASVDNLARSEGGDRFVSNNRLEVSVWRRGADGDWTRSEALVPLGSRPAGLALNSTGKLLAAGMADGTVELRDPDAPKTVLGPRLGRKVEKGVDMVSSLAFWGTDRLVAGQAESGEVWLWDLENLTAQDAYVTAERAYHFNLGVGLTSVTFLGSENRIATGDRRGRVYVREIYSGEGGAYAPLFKHADEVTALKDVETDRGRLLASASSDGSVVLNWLDETGKTKAERIVQLRSDSALTSLAVSQNAEWVAAGTKSTGEIVLWKTDSGSRPVATWTAIRSGRKTVTDLYFQSGDHHLVSGGADGLHTWDLTLLKAYWENGSAAPQFKNAYEQTREKYSHWWSDLDLVPHPPELVSQTAATAVSPSAPSRPSRQIPPMPDRNSNVGPAWGAVGIFLWFMVCLIPVVRRVARSGKHVGA